MPSHPNSYLSSKIEARSKNSKMGVFARESINKNELLIVWGGVVYTGDEYQKLPEDYRYRGIQIEEDMFLSPRVIEAADYVNHSCDPNAGLSGQVALVAMRDIAPNEEICFDYAMSDGCGYDEFDCECGVPNCRRHITGNDWQIEELWERYMGYFSPYLMRRIENICLQNRTNWSGQRTSNTEFKLAPFYKVDTSHLRKGS